MSIFKIEVKTTEKIDNETIMTATVKNGNWRAWENWQDTTTEQPLTINTLGDFSILHEPTKLITDNYERINGEYKANGKEYRLYTSLVDLLSIALNWSKERDYFTKWTYGAIICHFNGYHSEITEESDLNYANYEKVLIIIEEVD